MNKRVIIKIVILVAFGAFVYFRSAERMRQRIDERNAAQPVATLPAPQPGTIIHTGEPRRAVTRQYNRTIVRVSDGDTIVLDGNEKIRLLGVDTPEKFESDKLDKQAKKLGVNPRDIVKLGERASAFTKKLCAGKKCALVLDKRPKDDYGRTLGYIYLEGDIFLNQELITNGFASVYKFFDYSQKGHFLTLERQARQEKRGLWAEPLFSTITDR